MIIVLFIIFFIIGFLIYSSSFKNPYKLYFVFGKKGSGKSTYLVKQALKYQKKGFKIYHNLEDMQVPGSRLISIEDLGEFVPEPESVILLDEVGMFFDNRNFKNFKNEVRDFFKLQRHYHCIVYLASQTWDIDKKLRDLTDEFYLCTNFFNVCSLVRPIKRMVFLTEADSSSESRIADNLKFKPITEWSLTYIPNFAKYFDSFTVPEMPKLPFIPVLPDLAPEILKPFKLKQLTYSPRHTKHAFSFRRHPDFVDWFQNTRFVKLFDRLLAHAVDRSEFDYDDRYVYVAEFTLLVVLGAFVLLGFAVIMIA